ncbi:MAG: winged helix-turn-helix transcriptional regulator [Chitinispirillaceae bacterium]|nr:winged helix-turn-helix transcriptional regulator [Chitinispirillaceae bacterium]
MGKTTMLLMVQFRIAELDLSKRWQPIKFPEESYSINDLADLWIETLHLVVAATNDTALEPELVALRAGHLSLDDLRERAWAIIKDWCTTRKKKLLLLIDNFDMIIEQIGDDREKARLRDILMNDGTVMFIGTAVSFFKEASYDKPFYHFFRVFDLKGLTHDDAVNLLKRRAEMDNVYNFDALLAESEGRFPALEYFTGGNPRLILMLYRVVAEWGSAEVRQALEKLLDEITPYYKSRTEILPPQQRKILDHIARESAKSFEGLSPSDIATATRSKSNHVSMQLKRLAEAGYVRSANIKGRSSCYTLSEPIVCHLVPDALFSDSKGADAVAGEFSEGVVRAAAVAGGSEVGEGEGGWVLQSTGTGESPVCSGAWKIFA